MAENLPNEILAQELSYIRERCPVIAEAGKKHFANTPLVTNAPWNPSVDQKIRQFYIDVAPLTPETLLPNFWEHELLVSIYARRLAALIALAVVSPLKAQANGFLHDLGRVVIPHRYFVNDLVGNILFGSIGFRRDFQLDMYPSDRSLGFYNPLKYLKDLTLPQMINHVADGLGRRNPKGELVKVSNLLQAGSARAYPGGVWETEDQALALATKREAWENRLRIKEVNNFRSKFGIDFETLREAVWAEFQDDRNQQWLEDVKNLVPKGR